EGIMVTLQVKRNIRLLVEKSKLLQAAQLTLDMAELAQKAELGIVIGNDEFIRSLNKKYRQVDAPTDVLSFTAGEVDPDTSDLYLGDVVLSLPRAQEQANTGGHLLVEELQLLVVHGSLHLLGYDHVEASEKNKMQAAQDKILGELGVRAIGKL
ncbi:MAG: rRNA maturation RNase YbeY, partial [Anaerolineae bacterium]|nr:rRNA maturation RNase YbeY [Anaerolineae bacterium]